MIGVESKLRIFTLQRAINDYAEEPLLAVLPGVALQELWAVVGVAETALLGVSLMVVASNLVARTLRHGTKSQLLRRLKMARPIIC